MGALSWDAVATIVTGVLAVGAAVFVGLRQLRLMSEQTAIAARQVDLETLKLRSELFDRRMKVYDTTVKWLRHFWANGHAPADALREDYIWAIETAKFLFRPAVAQQMTHWLRQASQHDRLLWGADPASSMPLAQELNDVAKTVNALFGEEMRLGAGGQDVEVTRS